jgi:hypothetical protein
MVRRLAVLAFVLLACTYEVPVDAPIEDLNLDVALIYAPCTDAGIDAWVF